MGHRSRKRSVLTEVKDGLSEEVCSAVRCISRDERTDCDCRDRHRYNRLAASTGITKRFYVPDDWVTSDLALPAAKEALKRAGRKREDVTPDTAVVLQYKLGAKNAGTFDVGCACAAFPPMIAIGSGLIGANAAIKTILVIAVDMIHRLTDPNDPGCFLWKGPIKQPKRGARQVCRKPACRRAAARPRGASFSHPSSWLAPTPCRRAVRSSADLAGRSCWLFGRPLRSIPPLMMNKREHNRSDRISAKMAQR
jgi:hypothetical protein